jgi:predicted short-subunit dehydrogenase-like oxidoreductase (DUF2520 family)
MAGLDFAVVGPGRVGLQLARQFINHGGRCLGIRGRNPQRPTEIAPGLRDVVFDTWREPRLRAAPIVFVTVPDRQIADVATDLAASLALDGSVVLHTSGLLTADALGPCREAGATVGSWHPLQTFPPIGAREAVWTDVWCAVEGDPAACELGFEVAHLLGMHPWRIEPEHKAVYHAAAAVAANLSHVLVVLGGQLLQECGLRPEKGPSPLAPLVLASTRNALDARQFENLTGAIARRDHATVRKHLEVLPAPVAAVYRELQSYFEAKAGSGDASREQVTAESCRRHHPTR